MFNLKVPRDFLPWLTILGLVLVAGSTAGRTGVPLSKLFRTGIAGTSPVLIVTDESMPDEALFQNLSGPAVTKDGDLYVCDVEGNHVKHIGSDGKLIRIFGRKGSGPGDLAFPLYAAAAAGRVCIWESGNRRFSIFTTGGEFIKILDLPQGFNRMLQVRMLPDGRIAAFVLRDVVTDKKSCQDCAIVVSPHSDAGWKTIYERRLQIWNRIDRPAHMCVPLPFNPKVCWDVTPEGLIAIGFSEDYKIELYHPDSGWVRGFCHEYKPVPTNSEDKKAHFAAMTVTFVGTDGSRSRTRGAPDYIVKNTSFPKYKPAFREISTDDEGNIWVEPYLENRSEEGTVFEAFDSNGEFLGRVRLTGGGMVPRYGRFSRVVNKSYWAVETGEDGFFRLVRYEIGG